MIFENLTLIVPLQYEGESMQESLFRAKIFQRPFGVRWVTIELVNDLISFALKAIGESHPERLTS